ncbi:MAG: T9SS type B sorting domain-containing protein [Aureibaculum sp.]|nr:T9SS type B sorting domain-containing protein [Aureibaculum sp.]
MNSVQNTHRYLLVCIVVLLLFPSFIHAQTTVPFSKRYETAGIFGDLTIIGNSILGPSSDTPYYGTALNDNINMVFVDIDGDPSTFSSSSATFTTSSCNRVVYAGLYWGAYLAPSTPAPNEVKFKIPGGTYQDLTADANLDLIYYKDVTDIVTTNLHASGDYYVANVSSTLGRQNSAGWSLVIVFEDPTESRKYISTFDGFSAVRNAPFNQVDFNYSGFVTPPSGPVEGRVGVAALEGDYRLVGDQMLFKADGNSTFTALSDAENREDNFFNSKITENGTIVTDRNLNSTNTLGWDQKLLNLTDLNPGNSLIGNNETGATVRVTNNVGGDWISTFLNTFAINIIEPYFQVLTSVEDDAGNVITHQSPVPLGATVWYNINFQNIGTDNAQNSYILNTLPINVTLDESSIELPAGVTYSYNPVNRELRFDIADELVEKEILSTSHDIRYKVVASNDCFDYTDACTNILVNSILSYYDGENSGQNVSGQPGLNDINGCGLGSIGSMDLYVNTSSCQYNSVETFCNDTIIISGHDGYNEYEWVDENGITVGNEQLLEVNGPGVFTAIQTKTGCTVTIRIITVLGLDVTFSSSDALCKDSEDGKVNIQVNEASSNYTYELFQGVNLVASEGPIITNHHEFIGIDIGTYEAKVTNADGCYDIQTITIGEPTLLQANNTVLDNIMPCNGNVLSGRIEIDASGGTPDYEYSIDNGATYQELNIFEVTTQGTHVITVRDANQCITTTTAIVDFDEEIQYNITTEDIVCLGDSDGSAAVNITNNSAGNTLSYSIDGGVSFQISPIFTGLAKGNYEIIIRKDKGVNFCETIENVIIDQLVDLNFSAETEFSCEGSSNQIIASVDPQYANEVTYTLDGTIEQATGFFEDVADGEHTLTVEHNSTGCKDEPITITVHAYIPVAIGDLVESGLNEYTVIATNGEPQYEYAMNDENDFGSSNVFDIISSGTYVFYVRDTTGCIVERSFELEFLDIEIPNFFTPDGDGINDSWYPRNIEIYPNLTVVIFDRYQRLIATYKGNRTAWNGSYNNKLLPSGDYWYIVKLNQPDDTRVFKGNFTLYR